MKPGVSGTLRATGTIAFSRSVDMDQRTEVAVATELSFWRRALGTGVLLGGMVLFSWLMAGTASAEAPDRPAHAERGHADDHGRGLSDVLAPKKSPPENAAPAPEKRAAAEKPAPAPSTPPKDRPAPRETRPTAALEKQVAETGQRVREITRPVTRTVTETLDRTPVAPVTRAVTSTAGETVQKVVREVRRTVGSTPVDPMLDVTDGVAGDLSGAPVSETVESDESSTLVDETPSPAPKQPSSGVRLDEPVADPEPRAAPPPAAAPDDLHEQVLDRSGASAPEQLPGTPTDPTDVTPPCAQSGAASPSAPGAAADHAVNALDLRAAGLPVPADPLVRAGGPSYSPGCSPD
jgi:hypothetical protein